MKQLFLLGLTLLSFNASADEGLFRSTPPANLQAAWDNTIFVEMGKHSATGTIIRQKTIGTKHYLFVLTAGHLFLGWPDSQPVTPLQNLLIPTIYKNVRVYEKPVFVPGKTGVQGSQAISDPTYEPIGTNLKFVWGLLKSNSEGSGTDAGLLVFEAENLIENFQPIYIAEPSEEVAGIQNFIIGFPAVALRTDSFQNVKIEEPQLLTKRWSKGNFKGQMNYDSTHLFSPSTADVLPGSSGSAFFSEQGHILGIVSGSSTNSEFNWAYRDSAGWSTTSMTTAGIRDFVTLTVAEFEKAIR